MKVCDKLSRSIRYWCKALNKCVRRKRIIKHEDMNLSDVKEKVFAEVIIYSIAFLFLFDDYVIRKIEVYATLMIAVGVFLIQYNAYKVKLVRDQEKIYKSRSKEIVEKCRLVTEYIMKKAKYDGNGDILILSTKDFGEDIKTVSQGKKYSVEWKFKYVSRTSEIRFGFAIRRIGDGSQLQSDRIFESIEYNEDDQNYYVCAFYYKSPNLPVKKDSEFDMELTDFSDEDWRSLIRLMAHVINDSWWRSDQYR